MSDIPIHVIVHMGEVDEKYELNYIANEGFDFDEDVSIASLLEENELQDGALSIPSILKERDQQHMSVSTTEDEFEDETTIEENGDCDMISFYDMDCGHLPMSSENLADQQELSYNVTDVTCPLCNFMADGGEAIVLPGCDHSICICCFQDHLRSCRKLALPVCCPLNSKRTCCQPLDQSLVQQIEAIELVHEDEEEEEKVNASNYHPCPSLGCTNVVYWKEGNGPPIGDCFQCNRTFCLKCGVTPYHTHNSCQEHQEEGAQNPHLIEERGESNTRRCYIE